MSNVLHLHENFKGHSPLLSHLNTAALTPTQITYKVLLGQKELPIGFVPLSSSSHRNPNTIITQHTMQ